jgi:PIN domain nuclease of toxin-antitoxin system
MASVWELAIKTARGKLPLPGRSVASLLDEVDRLGILILPIERAHILRTETLPHLHRDPFDRMIIAQSLAEGVPVLTADPMFARYGVEVIWK